MLSLNVRCRLAFLFAPVLISFAARSAPATDPPHVVFLVAEDEYKSEVSMPRVAHDLETQYGMKCTLLHDNNITSVWKPEPNQRLNDMPGLDILDKADLVVFFMRFRTFPEDQVAKIQAYLDSGRPVVGFRTATHSFNYAEGDPLHDHWNLFGARVLGAPWIRHYGHESSTDVSMIPEAAGNPILKGVDPEFHVRSWLYHVLPDYPPASATLLLRGKSVGPGSVPIEDRTINPVAWTLTHPGGGRVFTATMGHPEDFDVPAFRRLVVNGIHWALGKPVPDSYAPEEQTKGNFELLDGDRVVMIGDAFIEHERTAGYIEASLTSRYPGRRITFRNLGWPGDTVDIQERPLNFGDLSTHVKNQNPTVAFVSYGMSSSFEGADALARFKEGQQKILDMLAEQNLREIVLVSPIRHESLGPPFPDPAAHNKNLALYLKALEEIAQQRGCRFVDLYHGLWEEDTLSPPVCYTENGVHLNDFGYWCAGMVTLHELGVSGPAWRVKLDAGTGLADAEGTLIADVKPSHNGISFAATDACLPPPLKPREPEGIDRQPIPKGLDIDCHSLQVTGLSGKRYTLKAGGTTLERLPAEFFREGVSLSMASPEYARTEELRQAIIEKNQLFFYRWRAHNGEYIYGRRSKSSGDPDGQGNAGNDQFPAEMAEFDRLIAEKEKEIARLALPEAREYELVMEER